MDITTPRIRKYRDEKLAEGYAKATVNRHLSALRRIFTLMIKDGVLESKPHFPMLDESDNVRQGTVEPGDYERLLACLSDYLKDAAEFLYHSAWRVGKLRTLE